MSDRSIRRAAERKALKAARKNPAVLVGRAPSPACDSQVPPSLAAITQPSANGAAVQPALESPKPISAAQLSANQANAQKSTGPTTETGKLIASQNRRTHGLKGKFQVLPCESQEEFEQLFNQLEDEYNVRTASELLLIQTMAQSHWLRERALRLQQTTLDPATGEIADEKKFALYQRYFTTHNGSFHRAFSDLLKQRALKQKLVIGFEREKRQTEAHPFNVALKEMEILTDEQRLGVKNLKTMDLRADVVDHMWDVARQKAA